MEMCRTCPLKLRKSIEPYQQIPLKVDKSVWNIPREPQSSAFHWGPRHLVVFKAQMAAVQNARSHLTWWKVELPLGVLYILNYHKGNDSVRNPDIMMFFWGCPFVGEW